MNIRAEKEMRGEPEPSFWKDKTVLVTGSGGFAGGPLSEYLNNLGANVCCFLREGGTGESTAATRAGGNASLYHDRRDRCKLSTISTVFPIRARLTLQLAPCWVQ